MLVSNKRMIDTSCNDSQSAYRQALLATRTPDDQKRSSGSIVGGSGSSSNRDRDDDDRLLDVVGPSSSPPPLPALQPPQHPHLPLPPGHPHSGLFARLSFHW